MKIIDPELYFDLGRREGPICALAALTNALGVRPTMYIAPKDESGQYLRILGDVKAAIIHYISEEPIGVVYHISGVGPTASEAEFDLLRNLLNPVRQIPPHIKIDKLEHEVCLLTHSPRRPESFVRIKNADLGYIPGEQ